MYIQKLRLNQFRNYESLEIELDKEKNIFYGNNAQGKTNLLEAIFLSGFAKSFRTQKEKELIQSGKEEAIVEVCYQRKDREGKIRIEIGEKKTFFINGIKVKKLSEILGKINLVFFYPDSMEMIKQGPNKRRRFLDMMIGQLKPSYIYYCNQYLKTLEQRNIYLRQIKFENKPEEMLEIWDEKLAEYGEKIFNERRIYLEKIAEKIEKIHKDVTENKEVISIKYVSSYQENYLKELKNKRKIDIQKGFTTYGVHRDDFLVFLNGRDLSAFGSQGQQRSSVISLKLTELAIIEEEVGEKPILLLDDFMSELDENRRNRFLEKITQNQVIITCTEKLKGIEGKTFHVQNGKI